MASNVEVKITADVVDLQAKFAVAKAESQALTGELNKLARGAAQAGGQMSDEMRAGLTKAAEASVKAKGEMQQLQAQLRNTHEEGGRFTSILETVRGGLEALGVIFAVEGVKRFGEA